MPMTSDIDYMRRCFALAERGLFTARPNPVVGCVLVKDGRVVGEGWHERTGQPHAEAIALNQAGAAAYGATAYVSLEPCSHHGRTPPCADALVDSRVARVVYAMQDPNPLVSGRGLARLRQAGIVVEGPLLPEEAESLNPGFCKRMRHGLPWVRCKVAMSLDGRIALRNGESKWITGPEARADVQRWRARSCAVLSGIGTVLQDDPGLNVRLEDFAGTQPLRVIADSNMRLPLTAALLRQSGTVVLACASEDAAAKARLEAAAGPARLLAVPLASASGQVDLSALLRYLAQQHHCNEVLLESGPALAGALLQAGLVDEVLAYVAPSLLGSAARPLFELPTIERLADRIRLQFLDVAMVGKDCRIRSLVLRGD
jgi:diaminohydroxyphosphoribosylaminopyrimidine deaminase / 5-amino-6-(5-phosphoribosylamino)uracil reductase